MLQELSLKEKIIAGAIAALVLLVVAQNVWWFSVRWSLVAGFEAWLENQQQRGAKLEITDWGVGGYPFRPRFYLEEMRGHLADGSQVTIPDLQLRIRPWLFRHASLEWDQPLQLESAGGKQRVRLAVEPGGLQAKFWGWGRPRALEWSEARATLSFFGFYDRPAPAVFLLRQFGLSLELPADPAEEGKIASLALRLADVTLPAIQPWPLGGTLQQLEFTATMRGTLPLGGDRRPYFIRLGEWANSGGVIDIEPLRLRWGPLDVAGNGTVTLDQERWLQASFALDIGGLPASLQRFAQAGAIPPEQAQPVIAMAEAMGRATAAASQGAAVVKLPLTIQNKEIYLGPLKIGAAPALPWN